MNSVIKIETVDLTLQFYARNEVFADKLASKITDLGLYSRKKRKKAIQSTLHMS